MGLGFLSGQYFYLGVFINFRSLYLVNVGYMYLFLERFLRFKWNIRLIFFCLCCIGFYVMSVFCLLWLFDFGDRFLELLLLFTQGVIVNIELCLGIFDNKLFYR